MSSKEKSMWDSLAPEEQQEFWNGMSQSEQIAFAQAMEHPQQVQPKPDQAKGAKSSLFQEGSRPIFTYTEAMKTRAGEKKLSLYRTNFEDAGVAGDYVLPPSTGYSAPMKKTVLGVAMVVVFCITWWLVAGEAWQAVKPAKQALDQAWKAYGPAYERAFSMTFGYAEHVRSEFTPIKQALDQAWKAYGQAYEQAYEQAKQAYEQAKLAYEQIDEKMKMLLRGSWGLPPEYDQLHANTNALAQTWQASIMADAHWRTQRSWGIGAGLLADVLLLVGALAWSKLTAKA